MPSEAGNHEITYKYTDVNNCSDSASQTIIVNRFTKIPLGLMNDTSVCKGEKLTLNTTFTGSVLWNPGKEKK